MNTTNKAQVIRAFSVVLHGVDHPQYYQGAGILPDNDFDKVIVGIGSTPLEALEDALETLATEGEFAFLEGEEPNAYKEFGDQADVELVALECDESEMVEEERQVYVELYVRAERYRNPTAPELVDMIAFENAKDALELLEKDQAGKCEFFFRLVSISTDQPIRSWDSGFGKIFVYCESLGVVGAVRTHPFEEAYECVVDEIMYDASATDLERESDTEELPEGCHYRPSGTPSNQDARHETGIACEDLNGSSLNELTAELCVELKLRIEILV